MSATPTATPAGSPSGAQLRALQTLYSKWQARTLDETSDPRALRLAWASESLGRNVSSFKDLTNKEAYQLINVLKTSLGQAINERPSRHRIRSRDLAHAAGTAGRRGAQSAVSYMVSPEDLARIENAIARLGWTRDRFEMWLRSSTSPLALKADRQIRTVADANRVWWALKNMLKQAGCWHPEDKGKFKNKAVPSRALTLPGA
jgi:hypothetical protein